MYRAVIIGAGNIAAGFDSPESEKILTHAHALLKHPDFELLGFYDTDEKKALGAAERWGGRAYADIESAVKNADVVCCCVPDRFHREILRKIAQFQPKIVIAEKPLTATYQEAKEIQDLYEGKIPLVVNYSRRFLKEFQFLKSEINSYGKFLKGVGYYGKGILHNGSHMIDILRFLLGEVEETKILGTPIFDFEFCDPSCDVLLKIQRKNFYMMAIDCRAVTIFEMELFFTRARVRIINGGEKIEIYRVEASDNYTGYENYLLQEERVVDYSQAMMRLMENVSGFLKQEQQLNCTLKDGLDVLKICMTIRGETI